MSAERIITCWSYDERGGLGGISPSGAVEFVRRIEQRGHCIVRDSRSERPLNHHLIGIGVSHDDAEFAEVGTSMAAYYENHPHRRWWEDTSSAFSTGVKYYGCRPTGKYPPCGDPTPEAQAIRAAAS